LFSVAQGGTLFLDEICELPSDMQPALLRVLDESLVRPVGSEVEKAVDVRVIAASNADVRAAMASGAFRSDLFARLSGQVIALPPLASVRERILAAFGEIERELGTPQQWSADALEALLLWDWPYNFRELELFVKRHQGAVSKDKIVTLADLRPGSPNIVERFGECRTGTTSGSPAVQPNRAELENLLGQFSGNVSAVAQKLGTSRSSLYRAMQRLGLATGDD
jgi:transcriptional regulator of acetoin/glycerol metabolism